MVSERLCGNKVSHPAFFRWGPGSQPGWKEPALPLPSLALLPVVLPDPQLGPGRHQCDPHACLSPGLKGTYQGLTATVLKQGSNQAIRFFVMTSLRNWYRGVFVALRHLGPGSSSSGLLTRAPPLGPPPSQALVHVPPQA